MSPLGYIIAGVLLLATGAGLWHLLLCWRDRTLKRVRTLESEAGLARAHNEADFGSLKVALTEFRATRATF